ncbi:hypothetical protein JCM19045_413 [Bacillus sp. JCM 19045]|nr:hypothetical protein JCM19045_413 [Bacillus sp. JCM 19045]
MTILSKEKEDYSIEINRVKEAGTKGYEHNDKTNGPNFGLIVFSFFIEMSVRSSRYSYGTARV